MADGDFLNIKKTCVVTYKAQPSQAFNTSVAVLFPGIVVIMKLLKSKPPFCQTTTSRCNFFS